MDDHASHEAQGLEAIPSRGYDQSMRGFKKRSEYILWAGDALAYVLVTLSGFASHGILRADTFVRMLATFIPFYLSWLVVMLWSNTSYPGDRRWVVRSGMSAILAAPLGATLRALWLNVPILPLFVLVMAGVAALGIMLWRGFFLGIIRRVKP